VAYKRIPYTPVGRTALAGCCASCDHGGGCESQLGDVDSAAKSTAFVLALIAGTIVFGFWSTKPKKRR
jgi:hypothetical protein